MVLLYHYTDEAGASGIRRDHRINISTKATDAFFGEGVYLTALPPHLGRRRIIDNNYDSAARLWKNPHLRRRADFYFMMDSENLEEVIQVPVRRDVWLFPGHIAYNNAKWKFGSTPDPVAQYHQLRSGPNVGQSLSWMMPQWQISRTVVPRRPFDWPFDY